MTPLAITTLILLGGVTVGLIYVIVAGYIKDKRRANDYLKALEKLKETREQAKKTGRPVITATQGNFRNINYQANRPAKETKADEIDITQNHPDFTTSMAIAAATDSALLGMAIGGDPIGGIVGASLSSDDSHSSSSSSDFGTSSFYEPSSDFGTSSSYDSGSSSDWSSSDSSSFDY